MSQALDLATFRRAMGIFAEELRRHREEIDSLNVYPVPDGDTGTNMLMTQEAVVTALASVSSDAVIAEEVGAAISRASLLGARGNSGVILSQVLRGMCERLPEHGTFGAEDFASALEHAAEEAYRAVATPTEGTMLSVIRDAAESARRAASSEQEDQDVAAVIEAALEEARRSLTRTSELLPELKRAGVVDAGGKGIVLLLDAVRAATDRGTPSESVGPLGPVGRPSEGVVEPAVDFSHEVQYLLEAEDGAIGSLRAALARIGGSVVVVGGGDLYNVHVHTNDPERAVELGSRVGRAREIQVADLKDRVTGCIGGQARAVRVGEQACTLIAVAEGEGLAETFRSLGAMVVTGGPGRNPSVADLIAGIEGSPADAVLVLPNHRNVAPAAELAAARSSKDVRVIPSTSIPAGLSAATAFNPLAALPDNAKAMDEAVAASRAGELARAERTSETPAGPAQRGDWLGLTEGKVVAVGGSVEAVAGAVVGHLVSETSEVITLIVGADAARTERRAIEEALRRSFPRLRLEVVEGGQPRYPFLIGME